MLGRHRFWSKTEIILILNSLVYFSVSFICPAIKFLWRNLMFLIFIKKTWRSSWWRNLMFFIFNAPQAFSQGWKKTFHQIKRNSKRPSQQQVYYLSVLVNLVKPRLIEPPFHTRSPYLPAITFLTYKCPSAKENSQSLFPKREVNYSSSLWVW